MPPAFPKKFLELSEWDGALHPNFNQGGYYAVIHENEPPNLKNIKPYFNTKYYSKDLKTITFNVNDEISGIDGEKNIVLKLNNNPVIFEFNSYQKKVLYQLENQLTIGTHSLEIIATDNANNIIKKEGIFTIK